MALWHYKPHVVILPASRDSSWHMGRRLSEGGGCSCQPSSGIVDHRGLEMINEERTSRIGTSLRCKTFKLLQDPFHLRKSALHFHDHWSTIVSASWTQSSMPIQRAWFQQEASVWWGCTRPDTHTDTFMSCDTPRYFRNTVSHQVIFWSWMGDNVRRISFPIMSVERGPNRIDSPCK